MIKDEEHACDTGSLFAYSSNLAKHVKHSRVGAKVIFHCGGTEKTPKASSDTLKVLQVLHVG